MRVSMHRRLLPLIMVIALVASFVPVLPAAAVIPVPKTIYVDAVNGDDATGTGTAEAPYMSITHALGDADYGDTVDIAPGTYSPSETGEVFPLPITASAITLQGSDPYECIIDAEWDDNIIWMMDGSDFTISGLTLTHGVGAGGGAIVVGFGSALTMTDCILMENFAIEGGAIFAESSTVTLTDCEFTDNGESANLVPSSIPPQVAIECSLGGAIYAVNSTVDISGGLISGNSAMNDGGAIFLGGSTATIDGTALFMNDVAASMMPASEVPLLGDGLLPTAVGRPSFGGAVYAEVTNLDVTDCGFWANTALIGSSVIGMDSNIAVDGSWFEGDSSLAGVVGNIGGFMGDKSASTPDAISPANIVDPYLSVENSTFQGNEGAVIVAQECDAFVSNVLAYDNSTSMDRLEGQATFLFLASDANVVNCTLADNVNPGASIYAVPMIEQNSTELLPGPLEVRVTNSIVWDANEGETSVEGATVTYSDLMYTGELVPTAFDESVISEDPMFVDTEEGDYSLASGSPCIDTGLGFELAPEDDLDGVSRPVDGDASGDAEWDMGALEFHTDVTDGRIEGDDRYETAVEISQDHFDSAETAILATGRIFADGLSASGLAGAYNAPVLLTQPNTLPSGVAQELLRLGVNHVIICGDERAISAGVEDAVASLGKITVERIGGADRYETAALIADEIAVVTESDPPLVFVARGDTYPDALAVSPIAWSMSAPVLLVRPTELPRYTIDYFLDTIAGTKTRTIIVGGEAAVSSGVESCMMALGVAPEDRIAGADRYETAVEVAYWAEGMGFADFSVVGVATGEDFADALAGGPGIGASGGVLLLNPKSTANPAVCDAISDHAGDISVLQIFGSGAAITDEVADELNDCRSISD